MRVVFSRHAVESMQARGVAAAEVDAILRNYENRYVGSPMHRGRPTPHRFMYQLGKLAVCTYEAPNSHEIRVITVLLREREQWDNERARAR